MVDPRGVEDVKYIVDVYIKLLMLWTPVMVQ
jgi:hypothetical protein